MTRAPSGAQPVQMTVVVTVALAVLFWPVIEQLTVVPPRIVSRRFLTDNAIKTLFLARG
jgi:hypothetical protein